VRRLTAQAKSSSMATLRHSDPAVRAPGVGNFGSPPSAAILDPAVPMRFLPMLSALALAFLAGPLAAQSWRRPVEQLLDRPPLDRYFWGVAVADSTGRLLFGRNAERLFIPASNTKLVVSAAAAVLLSPQWTVRTSLYGTGPVVDGVLQGHLVLYGRGDPTMDRRCFDVDTTRAGACRTDPFEPLLDLARQLKARGVQSVAGVLTTSTVLVRKPRPVTGAAYHQGRSPHSHVG
jgi:serine-type D-Ala-D-Ala carboxypeptidase/endopeptidase (penicillin-binding protein 4)